MIIWTDAGRINANKILYSSLCFISTVKIINIAIIINSNDQKCQTKSTPPTINIGSVDPAKKEIAHYTPLLWEDVVLGNGILKWHFFTQVEQPHVASIFFIIFLVWFCLFVFVFDFVIVYAKECAWWLFSHPWISRSQVANLLSS